MNIEFTVLKEGQPLKTISVELPVVIGRGTDSTLTIKHPLLSRRHCEVYNENDQVLVKDLASLNGTFVNDARVETTLPLTSGSQLKLGAVEIQVAFEGGAVSDLADADFEMGAFEAAETEAIPVAESTPADADNATFDLGGFEVNESAVADQAPVVDDAGFDLADFEVSEGDVAAEATPALGDAVAEAESLDLSDFEVSEGDVAAEATPALGDAVAEAESLDLSDFEVSTPEVPPAAEMLDLGEAEVPAPVAEAAAAEAQVELPSLMELAGGLDEVPADPPAAPVASDEAAPAVTDEPAADDPWAPLVENQVDADDDDLDAFLAELG